MKQKTVPGKQPLEVMFRFSTSSNSSIFFGWRKIRIVFDLQKFTGSYVDGLMASTFLATNDLVTCGHMSCLYMQTICPLALMKSDKPGSLSLQRA
jgi:hypothetical protein